MTKEEKLLGYLQRVEVPVDAMHIETALNMSKQSVSQSLGSLYAMQRVCKICICSASSVYGLSSICQEYWAVSKTAFAVVDLWEDVSSESEKTVRNVSKRKA